VEGQKWATPILREVSWSELGTLGNRLEVHMTRKNVFTESVTDVIAPTAVDADTIIPISKNHILAHHLYTLKIYPRDPTKTCAIAVSLELPFLARA